MIEEKQKKLNKIMHAAMMTEEKRRKKEVGHKDSKQKLHKKEKDSASDT